MSISLSSSVSWTVLWAHWYGSTRMDDVHEDAASTCISHRSHRVALAPDQPTVARCAEASSMISGRRVVMFARVQVRPHDGDTVIPLETDSVLQVAWSLAHSTTDALDHARLDMHTRMEETAIMGFHDDTRHGRAFPLQERQDLVTTESDASIHGRHSFHVVLAILQRQRRRARRIHSRARHRHILLAAIGASDEVGEADGYTTPHDCAVAAFCLFMRNPALSTASFGSKRRADGPPFSLR